MEIYIRTIVVKYLDHFNQVHMLDTVEVGEHKTFDSPTKMKEFAMDTANVKDLLLADRVQTSAVIEVKCVNHKNFYFWY